MRAFALALSETFVPSDSALLRLLFYVCANPPSGDLSGAALEVPSEALLHPRSYVREMPDILQHARIFLKIGCAF